VNKPITFTTNGTVQADGGTYLTRRADAELLDLCRRRDYAYVLTSRQMGKSSLMVATSEQLQQEGVHTAIVDLQPLGAQTTTADKWYIGVLDRIARKLGIRAELMNWWAAHQHLSEVQRLVQFFEDVVLTRIQAPIVVFFDEIDSTLKLDFTDDFFIAIRHLYVARAEKTAFRRLSFVMLGVAAPSMLIQDSQRTPFNIGKFVTLEGFTENDVIPLSEGLYDYANRPMRVLRSILDWTGGQPYLTQKTCEIIKDTAQKIARKPLIKSNHETDLVGHLIQKQLIKNWEVRDKSAHFANIQRRILESPSSAGRMLEIYRKVLKKQVIIFDGSAEHTELILSGIIKSSDNELSPTCKIYTEIFDDFWIARNLANLRPYAENLEYWSRSNFSDHSSLLKGDELLKIVEWSKGKLLPAEDYKFIHSSFVAEIEHKKEEYASEARKSKEAKKLVKQAIEKAKSSNKEAESSKEKAEREAIKTQKLIEFASQTKQKIEKYRKNAINARASAEKATAEKAIAEEEWLKAQKALSEIRVEIEDFEIMLKSKQDEINRLQEDLKQAKESKGTFGAFSALFSGIVVSLFAIFSSSIKTNEDKEETAQKIRMQCDNLRKENRWNPNAKEIINSLEKRLLEKL